MYQKSIQQSLYKNLARHISLSKKMAVATYCKHFFFFFLSNSLTALTANYKSAKVRKAPVIFQNSKTHFVPPYRDEGDEPNRDGMFKVTPVFHAEERKEKRGQRELFLTTERQRDQTVHSETSTPCT